MNRRTRRTTYTTDSPRHRSGARRWLPMVAAAILVPLLSIMFASTALALPAAQKEEFLVFSDCPLPQAEAGLCVVSTTTGGEFVIGSKKVPISKPITLQGGLATGSLGQQALIGAADGNTLQKVGEEVPGGLLGLIPGLNIGGEVTATTELAAPASSVLVSPGSTAAPGYNPGVAVVLPIKVHLQNELLGEECYIGSNAEPIVLHLYASHSSELEFGGNYKIEKVPRTVLSDTTFAVPAAKGCGGSDELINTLVNSEIGLPSEAGKNSVEMISSLEQTKGEYAHKYLPKKKKEKKVKPQK
jgi:hypothetical protein